MVVMIFAFVWFNSLTKLIFIQRNNDFVYRIFCFAHDNWEHAKGPETLKIMLKNVRLGRRYFLVLLLGLAVPGTQQTLNSIMAKVSGDRVEEILPMETICTFGGLSGWVYLGVTLMQIIQVVTSSTSYKSLD